MSEKKPFPNRSALGADANFLAAGNFSVPSSSSASAAALSGCRLPINPLPSLCQPPVLSSPFHIPVLKLQKQNKTSKPVLSSFGGSVVSSPSTSSTPSSTSSSASCSSSSSYCSSSDEFGNQMSGQAITTTTGTNTIKRFAALIDNSVKLPPF